MAVDGWAVTLQRGGALAAASPTQSPPHYTKCSSPPVNGQCTNHRIANLLYDGPLLCAINVV